MPLVRQRQSVFARNVGLLILFAYEQGFELTFGEAYRTAYQQAEYVRLGLSQTINSRHLIRLAVDFNIFLDGIYLLQKQTSFTADLLLVKKLGDYWESLNPDNVWGGDWNRDNVFDENFKDPYHFEMKP